MSTIPKVGAERRVVLKRPDGLWEIGQLWIGPCVAGEGFRIAREDKRAIYFVSTEEKADDSRQTKSDR